MSDGTVRAKQPYEMPFAEFASAVRPSGAVNRLPQIGNSNAVVSYSIYMNGKVGASLPPATQEQVFDGAVLHTVTERLGLNPESYRDNLKVAELIAVKSAWVSAVLDSSRVSTLERMQGKTAPELSQEVIEDFEKLAQGTGLGHPWMQAQIRTQQALSRNLRPAIEAAQEVIGKEVVERVPREIEVGRIVSQNLDFTVQEIEDGQIVAHENRRLESLPELGKNVTVTYYRGQGQVINNVKEMRLSDPYVDKDSGDLAVSLSSQRGEVREVVMFNSVASFAQFVDEHKLDKSLVEKAMDARAATPKVERPEVRSDRQPVSAIYFDREKEEIALDFVENGRKRTVFFGDAAVVAQKARDFNLSDEHMKDARAIEKARAAAEERFPGDREARHRFIEMAAPELKRRDTGGAEKAAPEPQRETQRDAKRGDELER